MNSQQNSNVPVPLASGPVSGVSQPQPQVQGQPGVSSSSSNNGNSHNGNSLNPFYNGGGVKGMNVPPPHQGGPPQGGKDPLQHAFNASPPQGGKDPLQHAFNASIAHYHANGGKGGPGYSMGGPYGGAPAMGPYGKPVRFTTGGPYGPGPYGKPVRFSRLIQVLIQVLTLS